MTVRATAAAVTASDHQGTGRRVGDAVRDGTIPSAVLSSRIEPIFTVHGSPRGTTSSTAVVISFSLWALTAASSRDGSFSILRL